jgi:oligopeptide/dipeptide ABC transporter ATP-binding protein
MNAALMALENVSVDFASPRGLVSAVSDASLSVGQGEIFGLVGESGSGKTTLAMAMMRLLPDSATVSGRVMFKGRDLALMKPAELRTLRGDRISMVFQDPLTSLDPSYGIGAQVAETVRAHQDVSERVARQRALDLLKEVGIPAADERYSDPPHRFSGGMRQRVVIATALANDPDLLLADEPTTALDVTIQAQILALLQELRVRRRMTIILIAHDLAVVAQLCDRVGVMYAGQLVETAPVGDLFADPWHPYTRALLDALPSGRQSRGMLKVIEGQVPDLVNPPPGCRFNLRCSHRMSACQERPPLVPQLDRAVACWWSSDANRRADAQMSPSLENEMPGSSRYR